ncbi:MAG: hypothetical protein K2Q22_08695, partial [Cytophagales bacterium]|nr:hypothetical protein [Cytophagales bacterium]
MKKLLAIFLITAPIVFSYAQTVSIPDSNLRKQLKLNYAQCFSGNNLRTACAATVTGSLLLNQCFDIPSLSYVNCNIKNMEGIQYFNSITYLDFNHNPLEVTTLPSFPSSLKYLDFNTCGTITSLPPLPSSLLYLDCSRNNVRSIPTLPPTLTAFWSQENRVNNLPSFPNSLIEIWLDYNLNSFTVLPALPVNLKKLNIWANRLASLPPLPNSLEYLYCVGNYLTSLPPLPSSLGSLFCTGNNGLKCLPYLPTSLTDLSTDVSCIPNKPNGLYTSIPLCNPSNNKNKCLAYPNISGWVFDDLNANGTKESNENYRSNIKIVAQPGNLITFSDSLGYYSINIPSIGTHSISAVNVPYFTSATSTVSFVTNTLTANSNFALQPTETIKDFAVSLTNMQALRIGFNQSIWITIENMGTVSAPATLSMTVPSIFYPTTTTGQPYNSSLMWNFPNMNPGEKYVIALYGSVATNATRGQSYQFKATVNPTDSSDSTLLNNTAILDLVAGASYDPNDKQAPKVLKPEKVASGEFIEYTIRFQNTGNLPAITVVVTDTLKGNLQWQTLELLSSSHSCKISNANNIIYFDHQNINLPDSIHNEPKSHGFVKYRIKPLNTLSVGDVITNKAGIYFD